MIRRHDPSVQEEEKQRLLVIVPVPEAAKSNHQNLLPDQALSICIDSLQHLPEGSGA